MWAASLRQVYRRDPEDQPYSCWVLFVRRGADNEKEIFIRGKHEEISTLLAEQGVNYTEITTRKGKQSVYSKFGFRNGKHPLFFVLSRHPLDYQKDDSLLVVEWCKWQDSDEMRDAVMAFADSFSEEEFRNAVASSQDPSAWKLVAKFLEKHASTIVKIGVTVAGALA